jgi:O-antigen/teichoic acid export membrane protein
LQADTLLIGTLGGPTVTAQFVLVWKIAEVLILMLARISQHLQPELIDMDAKGDIVRLRRVYRDASLYMLLAGALIGGGYALFGQWLVGLWIGHGEAPQNAWAYVLAGGAVFWLGSSRLQAVFAYSRVKLRPLIRLSATELAAKLILVFALYPYVGYLSPLIAINLVYVCGIAYAYVAMNRSLLTGRQADAGVGSLGNG